MFYAKILCFVRKLYGQWENSMICVKTLCFVRTRNVLCENSMFYVRKLYVICAKTSAEYHSINQGELVSGVNNVHSA